MNKAEENPKLIHFPEVDSTNKAINNISESEKLPSGSIVIADFQTAGRGQAGNSWESEAGKNLTFSIIFKPTYIPANMAFVISEIISLCVKRTLDMYISDITVKWPNDIYYKDKKIAGILIENSIQQGKISQSIVGIGINVNQSEFRSNAPNPVSLTQITGRSFDLMAILENFRLILAEQNERINKSETCNLYFETIHNDYINSVYRKEGYHKYRDDNDLFEAEIYKIEPSGHLILKRTDGSLLRYAFKEVSFVMD